MSSGPVASTGRLEFDLASRVERLMLHPLYAALRDESSLRVFMRAHVFAVWDFQCLLKSLQRSLTCVELPWLPTPDPQARRFVNAIVLDEESDEAPDGSYLSHFELYLQAMRECGADTGPIRTFLSELSRGCTPEQALARPDVPRGVAAFVGSTLEAAMSDKPHCVAAAFAYGREEIIPGMFRHIVTALAGLAPQRWSTLQYYLERHIGTDAERHAPLARALVSRLCGSDAALLAEAEATAQRGLDARCRLLDEILVSLAEVQRHEDGQRVDRAGV